MADEAVPQLTAHVRGVIDLRDHVIPLIDLRIKFDRTTESNGRTCVVVVQVDSSAGTALSMGFIVGPVDDVTTVTAAEIEPIPEFGCPVDRSPLLGLAKVNGQVKTLLSIEPLLESGRTSAIGVIPLAVDAALIVQKNPSRNRAWTCCAIPCPPPSSRPRVCARAARSSAPAGPSTAPNSAEFRRSGAPRNSTVPKPTPIVAAGQAAGTAAKEDGVDCRVAKQRTRNPKNLPAPAEEAIVRTLDPPGAEEYV